ncbi:MAG: hypothetical protein BZY87_06305 [SAR202 cluster bacterium Io17-Chloro-G6]|nr:MAG: hypothetical protein BZY87_06305 [SAR202 cluster bacterium Io17-Chloro-G6]
MTTISNAEEAINAADHFMRKYYSYMRPLSAKQDEQTWLVVFDVGVVKIQRVEVRIESETGSILEFNDLSQS